MTMARSEANYLAELRMRLFAEDEYIDTGDALNYIAALEDSLRVLANVNVQRRMEELFPSCSECGTREHDGLYKGLCDSCVHDARRSGWEG